MTDEREQDETGKDAYPADSQFGRAAAADAERADENSAPPSQQRDQVRAANKAEPEDDEDDIVDEQLRESFPASDPPSNR